MPNCERCGAHFERTSRRMGRKRFCSDLCRTGRKAPKAQDPLTSHPATTERIYDDPEAELLRRVEAYKKRSGRKFVGPCEVLAILVREMGYVRPNDEAHLRGGAANPRARAPGMLRETSGAAPSGAAPG